MGTVRFNPPPGWHLAPDGGLPPADWRPAAELPPAPPGWAYYLDQRGRPVSTPAGVWAPPEPDRTPDFAPALHSAQTPDSVPAPEPEPDAIPEPDAVPAPDALPEPDAEPGDAASGPSPGRHRSERRSRRWPALLVAAALSLTVVVAGALSLLG